MATIAGKLHRVAGIFAIGAAILAVLLRHASAGWMGAFFNFVWHDPSSLLRDLPLVLSLTVTAAHLSHCSGRAFDWPAVSGRHD
jgi:hypothetical protein